MAQLSEKTSNWLEYIIIHYRWIIVCCFLLPLSFLYDIFYYIRTFVIFKLKSAPGQHDQRVKLVQHQIRQWNEEGRRKKMCTARPAWVGFTLRKPSYKRQLFNVSIDLMDILNVDTDNRTIRVEPLATMGQISAILCKLGWSLTVIPELDDITVGGLVCGDGLESSSHIYGLFQDIMVSCDVVLPDASLVHCSKDENSDIFYTIPWTRGTVGFLVACELRIMPIKPLIRLGYIPAFSRTSFADILNAECIDPKKNDFVEGIMYSANTGIVITGNMEDKPNNGEYINYIGRYYKPWFHEHVRQYLKPGIHTELVPFRDYCHRHSRSIFWEMSDIVPFGNKPLFRYLFGWLVPPKVSLLKLTTTPTIQKLYEEKQIIQDMFVPGDKLDETFKFVDENINVYPLWLCPAKIFENPGLVHPAKPPSQLYFDVGIWGTPQNPNWNHKSTVALLEKYVRDNKGFQMLYADCRQSNEEFREMFDHSLYDQVRAKYGCTDAFPELLEKIKPSTQY